MTKETFLTARWNNWLTLLIGIPILIYGIVYLSTDVTSAFPWFIGIAVAGAVY
ncbi:MAG: hypothetical protein JSV77_00010 [Dehalococcoidales bacterium]|nr:MAG: hypothetical protein JSV77_00010 [Dehalococcoidales bacterium]